MTCLPKTGVALCSYQGETFLGQQLAGIRGQSFAPCEVVIGDDGSTDTTLAICREFLRGSPFPLTLIVNEQNLGSTRNFEHTIARCTGEFIALCDQDDVWEPHKLERLAAALAENPQAAFVISDALLVDDMLQPLRCTLWEAIGFTPARRRELLSKRGLRLLFRRWVATGATMAFRASYRDLLLPIPECWVHDAWIAFILRSVAPCVLIDEPLIKYRQHSRQQIGGKKWSLREQFQFARSMTEDDFVRVRDMFVAARQRLRERASDRVADWIWRELDQKIEHAERRIALRRRRWRLPQVLGEVVRGRYSRYSLGWKSMAQDLFL